MVIFFSFVNRYILTNFSAFHSKLFLILDHIRSYVEKIHSVDQWCSTFWLVGHICLSETLRGPQELIISIKILLND